MTLKVYDVLGREVAALVDGIQEAGFKSVEWNASAVAGGLFFYRLEATATSSPTQAYTQVRKSLLLK